MPVEKFNLKAQRRPSVWVWFILKQSKIRAIEASLAKRHCNQMRHPRGNVKEFIFDLQYLSN